ncbi:MAG: transposase, partial [Methylococcales bacterium]|nr:transposase [Methylococcales bacterium]
MDCAYGFALAGLAEGVRKWASGHCALQPVGQERDMGKLIASVSAMPDVEYLMVDGSIVRIYQHGLSTKIHVAVDALGNPVRLLLTAGQRSEHTQAKALVDGFHADFVIAD